ncbi:MAG: DUF3524 domain-containing protein [Lentisphaeraceae bacterium]|nr:DUF3524 domain-containing protein [Lentisphaeraceae bacterium]
MRILALNPFHGGSHQAFLDGWIKRSRHDWTVLTLPDEFWRWRMFCSAAHFAEMLKSMDGEWDAVFCTSMMNLAEFKGLVSPTIAALPSIVYFHENQLTYPEGTHYKKDNRLMMINFHTLQAADKAWFNSAFHRDEFLDSLKKWLRNIPGKPFENTKFSSTEIHYPGINVLGFEKKKFSEPLRICWTARWEEDKNPQLFFDTLYALKEMNVDFKVSVFGESLNLIPQCFQDAKVRLQDEIEHWGFVEDYQEYLSALRSCHVVFSSADHEFFGIGVLEALGAGCLPVVPNRLAYPEVLRGFEEFFYTRKFAAAIAQHIVEISEKMKDVCWYEATQQRCLQQAYKYCRDAVSVNMDDAIEELTFTKANELNGTVTV